MEYVLHIGLPKTGTKSLQTALSENRQALLRHGVVYPVTGLMGKRKIYHVGLHDVLSGLGPERVGMPKDWVERFKEETACADMCVLSCERFSSLAEPGAIASLMPRERTRVVMYVREPVAHVVSLYRNKVKVLNMTMSLRDFAESYRLPYLSVAERWAAAFGSDNVLIRRYGRDNGRWDIVSDFANLIGLDRESAFPSRRYELNPGISGNLFFVKRVLNCFISRQHCPYLWADMRELMYMDDRFRGPIPVDQEMVDLISHRSREILVGLERRFGLSVRPRENPIEAPPCPDHGKLAQDFERILASARERNGSLAMQLERMTNMFAMEGAISQR